MQDQFNNMLSATAHDTPEKYERIWVPSGEILVPREPLDTLNFRCQQAVLEAQEAMHRFTEQQ